MEAKNVALVAYETYRYSLWGEDADTQGVPHFVDLAPHFQGAWNQAVQAAIKTQVLNTLFMLASLREGALAELIETNEQVTNTGELTDAS